LKAPRSSDDAPSRFPFAKSFQFRAHEALALEGLVDRSLFDLPFAPEVCDALEQFRFLPESGKPEGGPGDGGSPRAEDRAAARATLRGGEGPRPVVLCRGADGIGKTRIFRHLRSYARAKEVPVYETFNYDVEGIPLKPFLHTIRRILADLENGPALLEAYRYALEGLLPEAYPDAAPADLSKETGKPIDWLESEKVRVFDGIAQLLIDIASLQPLLILVHDLHWGDLATVDLLRYIGRNVQLRHQLAMRHGAAAGVDADPVGASGAPEDEERSGAVEDDASSEPAADAPSTESWRALTPGPVGPHVYGSWLDESWDDVASTDAREEEDLPRIPRLLILANYRAFEEAGHYIQRAIDALGEESYTFHGGLEPLGREEVDRFISRSVEGVSCDGRTLVVAPDGVERIYEASEGFPSFQNELFRGVFLAHAGETVGDRIVWNRAVIDEWLEPAGAVSTQETTANATGEETNGGSEKSNAAAKPTSEPRARRHQILARRVADATEIERRVLEILAVARRPVQSELVSRVLRGLDGDTSGAADDVATVLCELEERGIIEAHDVASGGADVDAIDASGPAYFFRLWDYTTILAEAIPSDIRGRMHRALADELRRSVEADLGRGEEGAYEVFYHYKRGDDPTLSIPFGTRAAERLTRSLAFRKARAIYLEVLDLLEASPEEDKDALALRLDLLERVARIGASLRDFSAAEAACRRVLAEDRGSLQPTDRVRLLILEASIVAESDPSRAIKIIAKATRALESETSLDAARVYLAMTRIRVLRQDWKRAINYALKGIAICQKTEEDSVELADLYFWSGRAFYGKGDYAHADDHYQRGLEEAERLGARWLMVRILDDLGRVYLDRGQYFRSARYLYKALEIRHRERDIAGLCRSYDQLALCYERNGDYLKTIENLNRSLHLKERIGAVEALNPTLGNLGDLYLRLGLYHKAMLWYRREMDNSRTLKARATDETVWLVDSFVRLGRACYEVGELRQAESLSKQASILASEFKLKAKEAETLHLEGLLRAADRDWTRAERALRGAAEAYAKNGERPREATALLDLGDTKFAREQYDEAFKLASRAQIIADEIKAADLQVRSLTLKANIHRFLKGGNADKVEEHFTKALEAAQNLSDVKILFDLYYSLAKVHHGRRELVEAANYYGKAEAILKRIVENLPADLAARYQDERARRTFREDLQRLRKEAAGRAPVAEARERAFAAVDTRDRPAGLSDYRDVLDRILRIHLAVHRLDFHDRILAEAVELAGADRGLILRVEKREYRPVAFLGFGKTPEQHPEVAAASQIAEEAIRRSRSILVAGGEDGPPGRYAHLSALAGRTLMAVPLSTEERIFGGIYIDRPESAGAFGVREEMLVDTLARHAGAACFERRQLEVAIQEPLTGFLTPSYFIERLREAYRLFNLHGRRFCVAGWFLPSLEHVLADTRDGLSERLSRELSRLVPHGAAVCWGNPVLYVLLDEIDTLEAGEVGDRVRDNLRELLGEDAPFDVLAASSQYQQGAEMYYEIRRRLLPEENDPWDLTELRVVLAKGVTIKEAKRLLEKHLIERTLERTGGNITHAARELGIHRPQLSNLLKKYSLRREVYGRAGGSMGLEGN